MVVRERCTEPTFMLIFYGFVILFFKGGGVMGDMVMAGTEVKDGGRSGSGLYFSGL